VVKDRRRGVIISARTRPPRPRKLFHRHEELARHDENNETTPQCARETRTRVVWMGGEGESSLQQKENSVESAAARTTIIYFW